MLLEQQVLAGPGGVQEVSKVPAGRVSADRDEAGAGLDVRGEEQAVPQVAVQESRVDGRRQDGKVAS